MQVLERSPRTRPPVSPAKCQAVRTGLLPPPKAMAILPVARDGHEEGRVGLALAHKLEELQEVVRTHGADPPSGEPPARKSLLLSMNPDRQDRLDAALEEARRLDGFTVPEWGLLEGPCQESMGGHPEHAPNSPPMKHEGSCAAGEREDPRAHARAVERQIRAVEEASRFRDGPDDFAEIEEAGGNALALGVLAQRITNALRGRDAAVHKEVAEGTIQRAEQIPAQKLRQEHAEAEQRQNRALGLRSMWGPTRHARPSGPESRRRKTSQGRRKEGAREHAGTARRGEGPQCPSVHGGRFRPEGRTVM